MKVYTTINQVKQDLPNIIGRINQLKLYFDTATMMLEDMQRLALDPDDPSWWGTLDAYSETLKNQIAYYAEMDYLQGLVSKLPRHADKYI